MFARLSWGVDPVVTDGGFATEPGMAAPAVEASATDAELVGDAPASATPFVGVPLLAGPSLSFMLACQMLSSAMSSVQVECARVVWFYFDGVAFRSRERNRKNEEAFF